MLFNKIKELKMYRRKRRSLLIMARAHRESLNFLDKLKVLMLELIENYLHF